MAPGARSNFGAPIFEPEVFQKQMYCIKESTCDIVGTFRRPGNCAFLRYSPDSKAHENVLANEKYRQRYLYKWFVCL